MNDAYLLLTIEELTMNEEFIHWARQEDGQDILMQKWLTSHPDQINKIDSAKALVNQLRYNSIQWDAEQKDALWNKIDQSTSDASIQSTSKLSMWRGLAVAATILVAALMVWIWPSSQSLININTNMAQNIERSLPDNSIIWINENSSISFDSLSFKTDKRVVNLSGEAQFQVSKNKGSFEVVTSRGKIVVLGTRFNVIDKDGIFEVSCYEGKVQVEYNNKNWLLRAGKSISWNDQNGEEVTKDVKVDGSASWINQKQYYTAQALSLIFDQLEKKFNVTIDFESNLGSRLYTGFTDNNSLENSLQSVCWPLHLKFKIEAKKVIITEE